MPRKPRRSEAEAATRMFLKLSPQTQAAIAAVVLLIVAVGLAIAVVTRKSPKKSVPTPTEIQDQHTPPGSTKPSPTPDIAGTRYFFCFWNVENLFDDRKDSRRENADAEYDVPFATDTHFRNLKLSRLAETLLRMNQGRGPDIFACCEVETPRAAELLKNALNERISDPKLRYTHLEIKDLEAGRHIATGLITRVPTESSRTHLLGYKLRILETRVTVDGHDLTILVTHWTSQITDKSGTDPNKGRAKYGKTIAEEVARLSSSNPSADILICGDFNDTPESPAVQTFLRATGDASQVTPGSGRLLDLMAGKSAAEYGTLYYRRPLIYDHICVSPGMLDRRGWWCDPASVSTFTQGLIRNGSTHREPWRFANPKPAIPDDQRGYSDHFPVTVELSVQP